MDTAILATVSIVYSLARLSMLVWSAANATSVCKLAPVQEVAFRWIESVPESAMLPSYSNYQPNTRGEMAILRRGGDGLPLGRAGSNVQAGVSCCLTHQVYAYLGQQKYTSGRQQGLSS